MSELTEYEKRRLRNIAEKESLFAELLELKKQVNKAFAKPKRPFVKRIVDYGTRPKSRRLQNKPVHVFDDLRPPLETLKLNAILDYGHIEENYQKAESFFRTFHVNQIKPAAESICSSKNYIDRMKTLKTSAEPSGKIVSDKVCSLAIHPAEHKLLVSAGGKDGSLGLWNIDLEAPWIPHYKPNPFLSREVSAKDIFTFKTHIKAVCFQSWDRYKNQNLITTSRDGTCRILDINKMQSRLLYVHDSIYNCDDISYSATQVTTMHQQIDSNAFLIAKPMDGSIGLVDIRVGHDETVHDFKLYKKGGPSEISLHPMDKNIVLACAQYKTPVLMDLRQCKSDLLEPVAKLDGSGAGQVISASFNSTGRKIAIAYEDKLRFYDTSVIKDTIKYETEANMINKRKVSKTGGKYICHKGTWHPEFKDLYFIGDYERREVGVWQATSEGAKKIHNFAAADESHLFTDIAIHPTLDVFVGGTNKGKVHAFVQQKKTENQPTEVVRIED